ncbi:MAG: FMN-binding glutamate synthase family protein, partial [Proteobacteria bacterium]|nr:FMN-binding glutamate synthase family protein [Pseudomonadota bacterium]
MFPIALAPRYIAFVLCIVLAVASGYLWRIWPDRIPLAICFAAFTAFSAVGIYDLCQKQHAVLRNYPVIAHLRFILEAIRPEMRQYFFEDETNGQPFSRNMRSVVYQRSKMQLDVLPFGTNYEVYSQGFEWLNHSISPIPASKEGFRVTIGGPECARPYSASVFNISAMSFGSLSANAIRALNSGAKLGGFAHDTGEGGYSPYHREGGGDIIW